MLKSIIVVTILSLNVDNTERIYAKYLDYQTVEKGQVSLSLAKSWGASNTAGADYVLMQPQSGKPVYLRFIEQDNANQHQAMKQLGWNATEILVQDPDALAKKLRLSPFTIVGEPTFLTHQKNIRAFQALGPNQELLYFTHIIDASLSKFDLGSATSYVDNVFIMVSGTRSLSATTLFYEQQLKTDVRGPYPYRIGVLSRAYDLPEDTLHNLSLAQLDEQFLIELDQYPIDAASLSRVLDELPAGIAMVTFEVSDLSSSTLTFLTPPSKKQAAPYFGRLSATSIGPDGELIEFIEIQKPK